MNWFSGCRSVVPAALATLLLAVSAGAAPFVVGTTPCGELKKVSTATGMQWQVSGCPELEKAINLQRTCGDGVVDPNEDCDTNGVSGFSADCKSVDKPYCDASLCRCIPVPTGTPTPTPTPIVSRTPTPLPGSCPNGELGWYPGYEGQFYGIVGRLDVGGTLTFCHTITAPLRQLKFSWGTQGNTCLSARLQLTPPAGSGLQPVLTDYNANSSYSYFGAPAGTYLVQVQANPDVNCSNGFRLTINAQ